MSNIFEQSSSNPNAAQSSFLGPSYSYSDNIRPPEQLGMSDDGSLQQLGTNITGLLNYVDILVDGSGDASVPGGPLGNKYFMKTGAKCTDTATNQQVDRYVYVNNVPFGPLPGLIPGIVTGLAVLNPFALLGAFSSGSNPPCMAITMETIDVNSNRGTDTHYVTLVDIKNMPSSNFPNGQSPIRESFSNYNTSTASSTINSEMDSSVNLPDDIMIQLYFVSLAGLGLYVLYRLGNR